MVAFETTLQIRVCVTLFYFLYLCSLCICVFVTEKRQHLRPVAAFVS